MKARVINNGRQGPPSRHSLPKGEDQRDWSSLVLVTSGDRRGRRRKNTIIVRERFQWSADKVKITSIMRLHNAFDTFCPCTEAGEVLVIKRVTQISWSSALGMLRCQWRTRNHRLTSLLRGTSGKTTAVSTGLCQSVAQRLQARFGPLWRIAAMPRAQSGSVIRNGKNIQLCVAGDVCDFACHLRGAGERESRSTGARPQRQR